MLPLEVPCLLRSPWQGMRSQIAECSPEETESLRRQLEAEKVPGGPPQLTPPQALAQPGVEGTAQPWAAAPLACLGGLGLQSIDACPAVCPRPPHCAFPISGSGLVPGAPHPPVLVQCPQQPLQPWQVKLAESAMHQQAMLEEHSAAFTQTLKVRRAGPYGGSSSCSKYH